MEEEVLQEEDEAKVLQMLVAEEIIRTQVIQVAKGLINKKFNVITVRNLDKKQVAVLNALDLEKTQWYHFVAVVIAGMGFFIDVYDL